MTSTATLDHCDRPTMRLRMVREPDAPDYGRLTTPADAERIVRPWLEGEAVEEAVLVALDARHHIIGTARLARGTVNAALFKPSDVMRMALLMGASSMIVAHNHPSGDPQPSAEDVRVTKRMVAAGRLLEVELLDHIVIGAAGRWTSMRERGLGFDA